ncbi:NmrA family NAD(P)-binding protein [Hymenobacter crusticola]|uniref:NAD-dependent dehydratase n=1 Tax=Hymenobacter crusticola TaxID=1770526 RepID=A0A243WET4_9BACT|nr:NAD(P)H-binding protein [Hymenobacter crusticola]OUJ74206.1 NAD-dependent dehydratase [Hymenobacter crusticola]
MKIVVTGSLGNISKPLVESLAQKGHAITVVSSKPEKQEAIEALGATAAIGSVEDAAFLTTAFSGADAVYLMIPPNFTEADQIAYYRRLGSNYVHAIRQTGVKRVVGLSSWGAHLDKGTGPILGSHHVEGLLNELTDVALTHLRPTSFYTNLYGFVSMIKGAGFIGANYGGDDKVAMVHPRDIADAAAEELTTAAATGQRIRYVSSDECTCNEAARALGAAIGKPDLAWVLFTDQQMQENLEKNGVPAPVATGVVELYASIHNGRLGEDYELHKPAMGKVKLADFAKEFAAAF